MVCTDAVTALYTARVTLLVNPVCGLTPSEIRTHTERQNDLSFNPSQKAPRFGLKGISCIEQLVSITEDVVIDYMHHVLLGVVKQSLYSIVCQKGFNKILK